MGTQAASKLTVCGLCDGGCFARVNVEEDRITRVSPVGEHDVVKNRLCVKGAALKTYVHAPERIERPMRRVGEKGSGQFEPISWEEAFETIAARLNQVKEESGAHATAFFSGHPKWLRYQLSELAAEYGTPNICTESSTCHTAPEIAYRLVFGYDTTKPDLRNCNTLIVWGANPAWSDGGKAADAIGVKERGGKLIVVDPRLTPTSERADVHLAIRPGTDGALALAMAHVILENGWEDKEFLTKYADGVEEFKPIAADMTVEKAAAICGVDGELIVKAAQLYATNGPAGMFTSGCGMAHSPNSVQNMRAVFLLQALTGNYGRKGGNGMGNAGWKLNGFHHAACPRVDVAKEFAAEEFPVWNELIVNEGQALGMDEAILDAKPYQLRNLIAFGMNYRMFPRSDRMLQALKECEFYVDVDLYWSDSAKYADIVLPAQAACERDTVHLLPGDRLLYLPRVIEPGEKLSDIEIIEGICAKLGLNGHMTGMRTLDEYLDWMLEPSGVTLEELKAQPEGMQARHTAEKPEMIFPTPSGKIEFKSRVLEKYSHLPGHEPLPFWRDYTQLNPDPERFPMIFSAGSRLAWFAHSRTYHLPWLSNLAPHPVVGLNPADAEKLGINDGDAVRLTTPVGSQVWTAQINSAVREGMICVLHDDEPSANDLVDADYREPISGFPGCRTYFCRVEKEVQG